MERLLATKKIKKSERHNKLGRKLRRRRSKREISLDKKKRKLFDRDMVNEEKDKRKQYAIFFTALSSKVPLEAFGTNFMLNGVSLYDMGHNSLITKSIYAEVRTMLHLEKSS